MIVVDANVLLYAVNEQTPNHEPARLWVEHALSGDESVGFAWSVLLAFLRIATLPAFAPEPLDVSEAFDVVDEWLAADPATIVHPTPRHAAILRGLLSASGTAGNLTADAHLATIALEHGARVCTFDRDFERFAGLEWFTPT